MYENYLAHYGVLGMHWGRRMGGKFEDTFARTRRPITMKEAGAAKGVFTNASSDKSSTFNVESAITV